MKKEDKGFRQSLQSIFAVKNHLPVQIKSWKVRVGDEVEKDETLGYYEYLVDNEKGETDTLLKGINAPFAGKITNLLPVESIIEEADVKLGTIEEPCSHSIQVHGLCALCGKDVNTASSSETKRATVSLSHKAGITVSEKVAENLETEKTGRLLKAKKLSLLLDLDQTVVHATVDQVVQQWLDDSNNINYPKLMDVHSFRLDGVPNIHFIKLRPGTKEFLETLSKIYELHIYTHGTRNYAHAVAQCLDPDGKYFSDRILSRCDSGSAQFKSLKRLFPYSESMVVAVDDRGDVWNWTSNLLKVKPYNYFIGTGDINEPGKATTESNGQSTRVVVDDNDNYLIHTIAALQRVHREFYEKYDRGEEANVCKILPAIKEEVLKGVHICFSGIVPTNQNPEYHEMWILATQFGAICRNTVTAETTHLIATKVGTNKVETAKNLEFVWILQPNWLLRCIEEFKHLPEKDFLLDSSLHPSIMNESNGKNFTNWDDADEELDAFLLEDDSDEDPDEDPSEIVHSNGTIDDDDNYDWLNLEIESAIQNPVASEIHSAANLKRKRESEA